MGFLRFPCDAFFQPDDPVFQCNVRICSRFGRRSNILLDSLDFLWCIFCEANPEFHLLWQFLCLVLPFVLRILDQLCIRIQKDVCLLCRGEDLGDIRLWL